jgi:outer membrane protein TolC
MHFKQMMRAALMLALVAPASAAAAPMTLDEAYRIAIQNNAQLRAAQESVKQAEINARRAWTYLGPQINGQISHSWNNEVTADFPYTDPRDPGLLSPPVNGSCPTDPAEVSFGAPVSAGAACFLTRPRVNQIVVRPAESTTFTLSGAQPIFQGQTIPALQAAWDAEDMAAANLQYAREQILFSVSQVYYNTAAAERFVRIQEQSLANLRDHLKTAQAKYAVGQIPRMGVLQAEIEVTRAEAAYSRARTDYRNALLAFANLLGIDDVPELESAEALTATTFAVNFPQDPTDAAYKNRGDLEAARKQVELARDQKNVNLLAFAPSLMLNGNIQKVDNPGSFGEEESWTVMLVLNVPLFQSGKRIFDAQESYSQIRQAESQLEAKRNEVKLDVATALAKLEVTQQNLAVAQKQAELSRENYQITKVSFDNGLATSLDLIDANQLLFSAEVNLTREQLNARLEALNVMRSAGLLTSALQVGPVEE